MHSTWQVVVRKCQEVSTTTRVPRASELGTTTELVTGGLTAQKSNLNQDVRTSVAGRKNSISLDEEEKNSKATRKSSNRLRPNNTRSK